MVPKEPDFTKPHAREVCMGNCPFHELLTKEMHVLSNAKLYEITWGDYIADLEAAALASETPAQREERLVKEARQAEEDKKRMEAVAIQSYTRKMGDQAMRGVKKGEGPKKYERPCRWMAGHDADSSRARGEEPCCWAWEYTDPKTKKFMTPRTCPFQHPREPGWHDEWLSNPRFNPSTLTSTSTPTNQLVETNNRFASLVSSDSSKRRRR